jgi:RND family efflux transporter MFP subunit
MSSSSEVRDPWSRLNIAGSHSAEPDKVWTQFGAAANPEEFCESLLALQCHLIGGVNDAVVVLQRPGTENFAPLAFWPEGRRDRSHLAEITERALRDARGIVEPRATRSSSALPHQPDYQLAYPVRLGGKVRGVVGLDVTWREEAQLQAAMRQLQWGSGWLEVLLHRYADPHEAAQLRIKLILEFVSAFLERPGFGDAATALVTDIGAKLGCDRVTLALMRGRELRVEAVSHATQFDRHANLLNATMAAMMEALDQGEPIVYPPDHEGRLVVTFAHAELAQLSGGVGIATFPLVHGGRQIGALTLERAPGLRFEAPVVELIEGLAAMLGPLVDIRREQARSLPAHAAASARGFRDKLLGPRHGTLKLAMLLVLAAALFLGVSTGDYRVSADARIEGEVQRVVSAPFQGYVREALRRAGDTVRQGEVLARLDERDLRLEQARLQAQREQYSKQHRDAMANRDRTAALIVGSQIEQTEALLTLVNEQLARAELKAPLDGIVVSGDLTQALGAPIERGQVLFEVASLDAYRVALQVDERHIADIDVGQRGELVLASLPRSRFDLTVNKITPVSTAMEGRNLFRVEARLESNPGDALRPGMEGIAKIHVDERRLISIWTRELVTWMRIKSWAWLP